MWPCLSNAEVGLEYSNRMEMAGKCLQEKGKGLPRVAGGVYTRVSMAARSKVEELLVRVDNSIWLK